MWKFGTVVIQYEEVGPGGVELKYGSMVNVFWIKLFHFCPRSIPRRVGACNTQPRTTINDGRQGEQWEYNGM